MTFYLNLQYKRKHCALELSLQLNAISIHKLKLKPNFISIFILLPVDGSMG